MIETRNLAKTYAVKERKGLFSSDKKVIEAVKDISIQIEKGAIIGLLGINGAGKTTTIKMLSTLLEPTRGSYSFDGVDALKSPSIVKQKINMIAGGERMIYWRLSAYENLWYFGQLYGVSNLVLKERIPKLLKSVGLEDKCHLPVETFSKGMKQRLQIARGLINDPSYIFMDEPTIGLDAVVTKELHKQIKSLAKEENKGILLTSHYLAEVEELCDYIYILNHGEMFLEGTKKQLSDQIFSKKYYELSFANQDGEMEETLKREIHRFDTTALITRTEEKIEVSSERNLGEFISEFCVSNRCHLKLLQEKEPSLEDIMLKIAKEEAS